MSPRSVCIVGIDGAFGRWFRAFFQSRGCKVDGYDDGANRDRIDRCVSSADVVVFCVPLLYAASAINDAAWSSREHQIWIDISSFKAQAMEALLETRASVVGIHPLFAPPRVTEGERPTWKGETVAVSDEHLGSSWKEWFQSFLEETGATIERVGCSKHDHVMLGSQALIHALLMAEALALRDVRVSGGDMVALSTRLSRGHHAGLARMLTGSPDVYAQIQVAHGHKAVAGIAALIAHLQKLRVLVERQDVAGIREMFLDARNSIGLETLEKMHGSGG